jgi:colanic acid biosynthesis glycosyl transferase WcaI
MRFLILGLNYLPESTSIGPYTADLAAHLQHCGHEVQVITGFPVAPYFKVWEGYQNRWFMREVVNGVKVIRTYLYVPARPERVLNRIAFDISFAASALLAGLAAGRADVIIAVSPPLQLGLTALAISRVKRARVFLLIKDMVPDAAIAAGMLPANSRAARFGYALERAIANRVARLGVICDGFKANLVAKGVSPDRITVIPDYVDLGFMREIDRNNSFRRKHSITNEQFVVTYSGSIALKQGLHVVVEAAARTIPDSALRFFVIGDGPYLPELRQAAARLEASNLTFLPLQPRDYLPLQLAAADALLITQRKTVGDCVFPGKLLYYMAAGRPIIAAVSSDSETGRFVSRHRVGLVVKPEEAGALAEGIDALRANRGLADEMGHNGRAIAERMFDRRRVLDDFATILTATAV